MEPCNAVKKIDFDYSPLSPAFARIGKPAQRALINNRIFTTNDLAKWRRDEIGSFHGVGPSVLAKLEEILGAEDLAFED